MTVVLKAYYDSSKDENEGKLLTLAGYAGTFDAWAFFEERWHRVLERWDCRYLHMTDAYGLYGAFSGKKGWTKERVDKMLNDLVSECLLPTGRWAENNHFQFYGAACTISLPEYERALVDIPKLKKKKPEAICVDYMVTVALSAIPEDLSQTTRKSGTAEIFFDNNEPFLRQIKAAWDRRHKRREDVLRLVSDVQPADSRSTYPLQAADFLAFTTRRSYASGDRKRAAFYNHLRQIATPTYDKFFDYDKLIEKYGGNKS